MRISTFTPKNPTTCHYQSKSKIHLHLFLAIHQQKSINVLIMFHTPGFFMCVFPTMFPFYFFHLHFLYESEAYPSFLTARGFAAPFGSEQ